MTFGQWSPDNQAAMKMQHLRWIELVQDSLSFTYEGRDRMQFILQDMEITNVASYIK